MMATVPQTSSSLLPLLETLEDGTAGQSEQTDAYLTIASHLSGGEGQQFLPAVVKHFSRLGKTLQIHIASEHLELSQAALQALGFCVFHLKVVSAIPASFSEELLTALSSLVVKSTDKNTCTRALWVISKQNFPLVVIAKKVPEVLQTLENVRTREDIQSAVMEHEALNVVIRLLEQAPEQMGEGAVQWARLVIPLVVHSASKLRLRAAAALEMGMPLLLRKQQEVAVIIEPIMATKLIPELQKLFSSKNEANVLKLWPLFVRLLGKLLHRGGPFINSMLQLEERGFRSSSPNIKKIAFIAWKSLIDNFALNPDILCSAKRLKLLMQPLNSIQVRMEALLLTKLEVWWYLMVKLGPNMAANFEQVGVPLLQCTLGLDSPTPARTSSQGGAVGTSTPKSGPAGVSSPATTPRLNLNSSIHPVQAYPSIQLLGLEMLLHYFLGSEVSATAARNKLLLSLEPLSHPLLSGPSSFTKHASLLISLVRDGFIAIGNEAPEALLTLIWKNLVSHISTALDAVGNKKDRQGCEVLTLMLQALQSIVSSGALSGQHILSLLEATGRGIPPRVLGSASYQVGKMDVLNGTPALFLIQLIFDSSLVSTVVEDERFYSCLETLVGCGLSGPTSPLAFGEAVLGAMGRCVPALENKEQLWRMWSTVVNPLTDTITQTNEVNQGDALDHNFSAVHTALMFPITHLLPGKPLHQTTQKSMLASWSRLYKVFARCSALVVTAEENVCCEELCAKMAAVLDTKTLPTLEAVAHVLLVIIESVDFSPYTPHFQQKMKSPHTPLTWVRKKRALGNLFSYQALLVQSLETLAGLDGPEAGCEAAGLTLVSVLSCLFTNLVLATALHEALVCLAQPLTLLYQQTDRSQNEPPKFSSTLAAKLEKLLCDLLGCLQARSALAYDDDLLQLLSPLLCVLFPHGNKQVRSLVTQFWNATFANTVVLTYPDQLKPVLSQVKQKTPIILPGFQAAEVRDELSGQYSSESSQLETKLSGVQVSSVGKRDSLLARAEEMDKNSKTSSKPVSTKLDFGSPKPLRREVLEEEASIDFVFIPPETKERVLTEHQKEVKRTKRVDIPAMYNNLDASLDTTVFSQYTQSQEESMDKLLADDQAEDAAKEGIRAEVKEGNMEAEDVPEVVMEKTQDYTSPTATADLTGEPKKNEEQPADYEMLPESPDVSTEEANGDVSAEVTDPRDAASPNASSDMVSGTPQKPNNSRRQSFVTLEKYAEGKAASPISVTKFTGPLTRTSNSQEPSSSPSSSSSPSQASQADIGSDPQACQPGQETPECSRNTQQERGETGKNEVEPTAEIAEKLPSEGEEYEDDVIPDTQVEVEQKAPVAEEVEANDSQEELDSEVLEASQCSPSQQASLSQGEPRRSGRRRSRPLWQGEEPDAGEEKGKKKGKGQQSPTDSQKATSSLVSQTDSQTRGRSTRSGKLVVEVVEEDGKDKVRKKASLKDKGLSSQSNSQLATPSPAAETHSQVPSRSSRRHKLQSDSEELVKDKHKGRRAAEEELSQSDSLTDPESDSQLQGRRSLRIQSVAEGEGRPKRRSRTTKEEGSSQDDSVATPSSASETDSQSQGRPSRRCKVVSESQELAKDTPKRSKREGTQDNLSQSDSQTSTTYSTTQSGGQSQSRSSRRSKAVSQSEEPVKDEKIRSGEAGAMLSQSDSQTATPSSATQPDGQSQGRSSSGSKVVSQLEKLVKDEQIRIGGTGAMLSQSDSQTATPSSATQPDGQSQGTSSSGSKVVSQLEEPVKDEQIGNGGADAILSQSDLQTATPSSATQPEGQSQDASSGMSEVSAEVVETDRSQNLVSDPAETKTGPTDSQLTPSTGSQTDGLKKHSRPRRLKMAELQAKPSNSPSSSPAMEAESSQGTQESSQSTGRITRRRSYQLLSSNVETSESDASKTREEVKTTNKRGRRGYSVVPLPTEPTRPQDIPMDSSDSSEKADPQNTPTSETKTPKDAEEPLKFQQSLAVRLPPVPTNIMEQGEVETRKDTEGEPSQDVDPVIAPDDAESEKNTKPTSQIENSSIEPDDGMKLPVPTSPRKKQRSEGRSLMSTEAPQEGDLGESPLSEEPGADGTYQFQNQQQAADTTQAGAPVPSSGSDLFSDDSVFMDPSASCTPPLSNEVSASTDKGEKICLSLHASESSEEKVPDIPQPEEVEKEELEVEQEKEAPMVVQENEVPKVVQENEVPKVEQEKEVQEKEVPKEVQEKEVPTEEQEKEVPTEEEVAEELVPDQDEKRSVSIEAPDVDHQDDAINLSTGEIPAECSHALEEEEGEGEQQQEEEKRHSSVEEGQLESDGSSTRTREEEEDAADHNAIPLQERDQASVMEREEAEEETQIDNNDLDLAVRAVVDSDAPLSDLPASTLPVATASTDSCQGSPAKQRGLEALVGAEVGQSPSSRTRVGWSPSASPSTSILKKGQKRPFEEESPSPLVKSRRVSFADPIQHQELADDIDRRSPAIRTSSPKTASGIPHLKCITTPTKGLVLSPRNLHSPGYKSSKKCLISEMGQEPRPIPRDCVYPALVSCSTPVEAVLPRITSNMWPRGFRQLVRARSIKTVGDLSALTPCEIKTLPIRSPKISNVRKALRSYHEQQRKGRGDELKSFDEMEKMTSEVEDVSIPLNQEDEDKSLGEALATALLDEPVAVEQEGPQQDPKPQGEGAGGLLSDWEALGAQMTPEGLGRCSEEQLHQLQEQILQLQEQMNDHLRGMMRSVMAQQQTRRTQRDSRP